MNVRRGLFRLWVLLSVLFAIGVVAVSYSGLHEEFRNTYTDWDAEFAKYGVVSIWPVDCAKARGTDID